MVILASIHSKSIIEIFKVEVENLLGNLSEKITFNIKCMARICYNDIN